MKKSREAIDLDLNPVFGNLKGARSHHAPDYAKNKDASVIPKGTKSAIPNEFWERDVSKSVFAEGFGDSPQGAFLARPGKNRAQPHKKINDQDH